MTLDKLADRLEAALLKFGLMEIWINRRTINNKDLWKDFLHRKESPYIQLYGIYIYTVDDESFNMEIHEIDGDITFYHRRVPSTIIELFTRAVFEMNLSIYINDGRFDYE